MQTNLSLTERIQQQEVWTFKECLTLSVQYDVKPRFVIAAVLAQGRSYIDGDKPVKPT